MRLETIRQVDPATAHHTKLIFTFTNFHDRTRGAFTPHKVPDREPDFISSGLSVYWDVGHGVIRASDHWVGHNGCTQIATCIWDFHGRAPRGDWVSGCCAYDAFTKREWTMRTRPAMSCDQEKADVLHRAGGALALPCWSAIFGPASIPDWARKAFPGAAGSEVADPLFRSDAALRHAVIAPQRSLDLILKSQCVPLGMGLN